MLPLTVAVLRCLCSLNTSCRMSKGLVPLQCNECDFCQYALQAFEAELQRTANLVSAPQGVVWKAMWRRHGKVFLIAGFIKLVHDCVMFLGPYVLEQLLKYLENGGSACEHCPASVKARTCGIARRLSLPSFFLTAACCTDCRLMPRCCQKYVCEE